MLEDARLAATQADQKLKSKCVEAGKYDLVLDPSHLWLTIHESGRPPFGIRQSFGLRSQLCGYQLPYLDKWKSGKFNFGSRM